jgi:hypothetical protein
MTLILNIYKELLSTFQKTTNTDTSTANTTNNTKYYKYHLFPIGGKNNLQTLKLIMSKSTKPKFANG